MTPTAFLEIPRGWKPPEGKGDDVAAFARTRVIPKGRHQPAFWRMRLHRRWKPVAIHHRPYRGEERQRFIKTEALGQ